MGVNGTPPSSPSPSSTASSCSSPILLDDDITPLPPAPATRRARDPSFGSDTVATIGCNGHGNAAAAAVDDDGGGDGALGKPNKAALSLSPPSEESLLPSASNTLNQSDESQTKNQPEELPFKNVKDSDCAVIKTTTPTADDPKQNAQFKCRPHQKKKSIASVEASLSSSSTLKNSELKSNIENHSRSFELSKTRTRFSVETSSDAAATASTSVELPPFKQSSLCHQNHLSTGSGSIKSNNSSSGGGGTKTGQKRKFKWMADDSSSSDDEEGYADACRRLAEQKKNGTLENSTTGSNSSNRSTKSFNQSKEIILHSSLKRKRENSSLELSYRSAKSLSYDSDGSAPSSLRTERMENGSRKSLSQPSNSFKSQQPSQPAKSEHTKPQSTNEPNNITEVSPQSDHQSITSAASPTIVSNASQSSTAAKSITNSTIETRNKSTSSTKLNCTEATKPMEPTQHAVQEPETSSKKTAISASSNPSNESSSNIDPVIPTPASTPSTVDWIVRHQCLLIRTCQNTPPRTKVAGFDLDQTLLHWRTTGWPTQFHHYELYSSSVIAKLRSLHDEGYKLVIFTNQGGIKGAFTGKTATKVKGLIDWLESLVERPIFAVCSTKKDGGYHKGNGGGVDGGAGMWRIMEEHCNKGVEVDVDSSLYVGDSDGKGSEDGEGGAGGAGGARVTSHQTQNYQMTGVDKQFAENVSQLCNATLKFYTPSEYFGQSHLEQRKGKELIQPIPPMPKEAQCARAALLGGYLHGPILLMLCGVQGSGKSTLCHSLLQGSGMNDGSAPPASSASSWCHYSQDTIRNGRPGTRQAVEKAVRNSLLQGKNVVLDRMHLDSDQRSLFLTIGKECSGVKVHMLVMMATKDEVYNRVKNRKHHPSKVEGEYGAKIAVGSLSKLVLPKYDEGFDLISYTNEVKGNLVECYRRVFVGDRVEEESNNSTSIPVNPLPKSLTLSIAGTNEEFPMITFGTMGIGKRAAPAIISQALQQGFSCVDTAPTYKNEGEIGRALNEYTAFSSDPASNENIRVICKIPKRATTPEQARKEVLQSLSLLNRSSADIILLHWPCDFIEADTLFDVWKELETMKKEGLCHMLGVSNFSVSALKKLLSKCTIPPVINQVERHPLLPQYDLLDYCSSKGIKLQAHSPLGHGSDKLLEQDVILRVANECSMSPAQVILCWNLQQGVAVVVKASSLDHMAEIMEVQKDEKGIFLLSPHHMKMIDDLALGKNGDVALHRFVAPPFMFSPGAVYSWGDRPPNK